MSQVFHEPVKPHPGAKWRSLLSSREFGSTSLKLIEAAPEAVGDIINDTNAPPLHVLRLYYVLGKSKVDDKLFLKPALRDLNHANAIVRDGAATFVGNVGGGSEFAAPLMMLMLFDPKPEVSIAARETLGKVGDASTVVALEHLIRFGTGKPDSPPRNEMLAKAFAVTRDEIKARLAAAAKPAPALPK